MPHPSGHPSPLGVMGDIAVARSGLATGARDSTSADIGAILVIRLRGQSDLKDAFSAFGSYDSLIDPNMTSATLDVVSMPVVLERQGLRLATVNDGIALHIEYVSVFSADITTLDKTVEGLEARFAKHGLGPLSGAQEPTTQQLVPAQGSATPTATVTSPRERKMRNTSLAASSSADREGHDRWASTEDDNVASMIEAAIRPQQRPWRSPFHHGAAQHHLVPSNRHAQREPFLQGGAPLRRRRLQSQRRRSPSPGARLDHWHPPPGDADASAGHRQAHACDS